MEYAYFNERKEEHLDQGHLCIYIESKRFFIKKTPLHLEQNLIFHSP